MRFFEERAVVIGDTADHVRIDADAVVRKNCESGNMLEKSHVRGTQGQWEIRRQGCGDAKAARHVDHRGDPDFFGELYRRNVARTGESAAQCDGAFEFFVVVARRIGLAAADGGQRRIDDGVEGSRAFFERVRVNVNFKRAANLAKSLCSAVEFGILKTVAANHGLDFTGGIIDGEQRALRAGLLFELDADSIVPQFLNGELSEVADPQKVRRFLAAGPGKIAGRKNRAVRADLDDGILFVNGEGETGYVASLFDRMAPIVVFVGVEFSEIVADDVWQIALPTMAAFIAVQAVAERLVGDALRADVQRGVDAQAAFMNGFGAIGGFEILADVFEEIGSEVVARILNVQTERRFPGGGFFSGRDLPFFFHAMEHQIAAGERSLRIGEWREFRAVDHACKERGFLKFQVGDRLAEIKLRSRCESIIAMREVHLVGIHGEDLRFGVAALDLQSQQHLLHFSSEAAVAAVEEKISGKLHGDGAGPAGNAALDDVVEGGAGDARKVDAPVFFKMLVLDGGDGVVKNLGALLVSHQDAALDGKAAGQLAVIGVNFRDHVGAVGFQRSNFRQVAGINEDQPAARA